MSGHYNWETCPWCKRQRKTTRDGRIFMQHRMWNGKQMVDCPGSGGQAGKNKAYAWKNRT